MKKKERKKRRIVMRVEEKELKKELIEVEGKKIEVR